MRLKTALLAVVVAVVALCGLLLVRTVIYSGDGSAAVASAAPATPPGPVDSTPLHRLSEAIQIATVTQFNVPANIPQFLRFHTFLRRSFPLVSSRAAAARRQVARLD